MTVRNDFSAVRNELDLTHQNIVEEIRGTMADTLLAHQSSSQHESRRLAKCLVRKLKILAEENTHLIFNPFEI